MPDVHRTPTFFSPCSSCSSRNPSKMSNSSPRSAESVNNTITLDSDTPVNSASPVGSPLEPLFENVESRRSRVEEMIRKRIAEEADRPAPDSTESFIQHLNDTVSPMSGNTSSAVQEVGDFTRLNNEVDEAEPAVGDMDSDDDDDEDDDDEEAEVAPKTGRARGVHVHIDPDVIARICDTDIDQAVLDYVEERYSRPRDVMLRIGTDEERPCSDGPDMMICYYDAFEWGFRLPVHPFVEEILKYYDIHIAQISPNGWRSIILYIGYSTEYHDGPKLEHFRCMFQIRNYSHMHGWYQFYFRSGWDNRGNAQNGWQRRWFVATCTNRFGYKGVWNCPDVSQKNKLTDLPKAFVKNVKKNIIGLYYKPEKRLAFPFSEADLKKYNLSLCGAEMRLSAKRVGMLRFIFSFKVF